MKRRVKSLFTLCLFAFSLMMSGFGAYAAEDAVSGETEEYASERFDYEASYSQFAEQVDFLYNENSYLFYDQLDANNRNAYDAMKVWLEPTTESFKYKLAEPIKYKTGTTNMNNWDEEQSKEFWNIVNSTFSFGINALFFDYPELFWLDPSKIMVSISTVRTSRDFFTGLYTMTISEIQLKGDVKDEYTDVETAKEYKQMLLDSAENFEVKGDDRYSRLKYIHDYIAETVSYSYDGPFRDSAAGIFCEPYEVVCEGYSKAFKLICDKENIPCVVVPGNINTEKNTGHMWNCVMMEDGKWYGIDLTWDDNNTDTNPFKYKWFLKGSDNFGSTHNFDTQFYGAGFDFPELSIDDYVYEEMPEFVNGDYNRDGELNAADLVLLKQFVVNSLPDDQTIPSDDLNDDGVINAFDYITLARMILGGI